MHFIWHFSEASGVKELDFKELDFKELCVLGYLLGVLDIYWAFPSNSMAFPSIGRSDEWAFR